MRWVIIGAVVDVRGHGHGIILIKSDKDKEQSDKKTMGVCREYKDSIYIL